MTVILASGSPRRSELLARLGLPFTVVVSGVDEPPPTADEDPEGYAVRLARRKVDAVHASNRDRVVLGADTVVVLDAEILGKPRDGADALRMLRALRGRAHRVVTAIAARGVRSTAEAVLATEVHMRQASDDELRRYIESGEPMDKAGAYAIQEVGGSFVSSYLGCYENVIGLPLCRTVVALRECGIEIPVDAGDKLDHHTDTLLRPG